MPKAETGKAKSKGAKNAQSAQDRFLSQLVAERAGVTVFLVNGIKLDGRIVAFDEHVILLEGEKTDHVYKHAVSTIQAEADAAVQPKRSVKPVPARAISRVAAREQPAIERASASDAAGDAPVPLRKPVVVVRAKRRSIKNTDEKS